MRDEKGDYEAQRIATIICVYKNDKSEYIASAIDSILYQTHTNLSIYIYVDGVVSDDIYQKIESYSNDARINVFFGETNKGLAFGLNYLIDIILADGECKYVARMDADDISSPDRFEKQVREAKNSKASVVGSDCYEVNEQGEVLFYKSMFNDDASIKENIIKRCPFVHPSVLFEIKVFRDGFRYNSKLSNTQDYFLWVELAEYGYKFSNINEPLLSFRVDRDFHSRRGFKKAMNEFKGRLYAIKRLKLLNFRNVFFMICYLVLRLMPSRISALAYRHCR